MSGEQMARMRNLIGSYDRIVTPPRSRPLLYRMLYFTDQPSAVAWSAPRWWKLMGEPRAVERRWKVRGKLKSRVVWMVNMMRVAS